MIWNLLVIVLAIFALKFCNFLIEHTMEKDVVSINVLNYNTYEKSKVCINSCLMQKDVSCQVLLIDNHSTDDSLEKLKTEFGDRIKYLENEDNYGYAKGNNIGVKYCVEQGVKYSFLLNSDTELVGENLLSQLVKIIKNNKLCAVVSPTIYDVTNKGLILHKNDSSYLRLLRFGCVLPNNKRIADNLWTISEAHGSALLVDNHAFLDVGGFPEHYFMYGEESTFAKNIIWSHKNIFWYNNDKHYVLHHHDKSGNVEPWRLYLMGRNRGIEYWEHKKSHLMWPFIYRFFCFSLAIKKDRFMASYIEGLKESEILHKSGASDTILYDHAKKIRDNYGR